MNYNLTPTTTTTVITIQDTKALIRLLESIVLNPTVRATNRPIVHLITLLLFLNNPKK